MKIKVPIIDLSSIFSTSAPPRRARAVLMPPSTSTVTAALVAVHDVDLGATQAVAACGRAVVVDTARRETSIILNMVVVGWCCCWWCDRCRVRGVRGARRDFKGRHAKIDK